MTIDSYISYMKHRHPKLFQQFKEQMDIIDQDRTSGTRAVRSMKCMQDWAEHVKKLMEQATTGKAVAS